MNFDEQHMSQAKKISVESKDPSTKCGSVVVDREEIYVFSGINKFPKNVEYGERLNNRDVKYKFMIHSEISAIINFLLKVVVLPYSIYIYPCAPCPTCLTTIIATGIKRICIPKDQKPAEELKSFGLKEHEEFMKTVCKEAGVEIVYV